MEENCCNCKEFWTEPFNDSNDQRERNEKRIEEAVRSKRDIFIFSPQLDTIPLAIIPESIYHIALGSRWHSSKIQRNDGIDGTALIFLINFWVTFMTLSIAEIFLSLLQR